MPAMDYSKVAKYYDLYAQTQMDVPFFIKESAGCKNILELTSGTGRLSIPLIRAGIPLTCLDSSPEMLAVLKSKLANLSLSIPIYEMDVCHFFIPHKFDLIIFPFNSFSEIWQPTLQVDALKCIVSHLEKGGRFICTFHNPVFRREHMDGKKIIRGKFPIPGNENTLVLSSDEKCIDGIGLVEGKQYYEIINPAGELVDQWSLDIRFYLHNDASFSRLIAPLGYQLSAVYGNYDYSPFDPEKSPFMIWVLKS